MCSHSIYFISQNLKQTLIQMAQKTSLRSPLHPLIYRPWHATRVWHWRVSIVVMSLWSNENNETVYRPLCLWRDTWGANRSHQTALSAVTWQRWIAWVRVEWQATQWGRGGCSEISHCWVPASVPHDNLHSSAWCATAARGEDTFHWQINKVG